MLAALLLASAHAPAAAQQPARDTTAARRDTARAVPDTGARPAVPLPSDTSHDTTKVPRDTIKAPLAEAPAPPLLGAGPQYHWDRAHLYASGAGTLLALLDRIPGVTTVRSGWLASPQYAAYLGDPARVRVFYDGMEVDALDPRSPGALDLGEVQLWSLEDVRVERGADEIRVYLRSWRVDRTATSTRVDVLTGDQGTNLYRGFYGKRFDNGMALQLGGQQYGTNSDPSVGGGSDLALIGRLGWAGPKWKVDAFASRSSRTRDQQDMLLVGTTGGVPEQDRTRTDAYLRAAYGDPDSAGVWLQAMAATQRFAESSPFRPALAFAPADSADTTRNAAQYVAAAGLTRGALRLSASDRFHRLPGRSMNALAGRIAFVQPRLAVSLRAEWRSGDTTSTEEGAVSFTPLSFVTLDGAVTRRHGGGSAARYDARAELGLRVHRLWLSGGVMRRDAELVPGLSAYDSSYAPALSGSATGIFGTARGKVYEDIGVDAMAVRWTAPGYYRPQLQTREEIYLDTQWLHRFPSGHFGFYGSIGHEYRQAVIFPRAGSVESVVGGGAVAVYSHVLVTRVEVRIHDAVLFWHSIYGITPLYEYVPGYVQPRQRFLYGVRWQFWN